MKWLECSKSMPPGGEIVWTWMPGWETPDLLETYTRPDRSIGFVSLIGNGAIEGITHWQTLIEPKPTVMEAKPTGAISKVILKGK